MIVIPSNLKGLDYCGSFRVRLDDNLSIDDAKRILKESPGIGIFIIDKELEEKPKKKKRGED